MAQRKKQLVLVGALVACAALAVGLGNVLSVSGQAIGAQEPAPEATEQYSADVAEAGSHRGLISDESNRTVVLFWSMSDSSSAERLRQLHSLSEQGWCTVAVNVDSANQSSQVRPFVHRLGVDSLDLRFDRSGSIARRLNAEAGDMLVQSETNEVAWQQTSLDDLGRPGAAGCLAVAAL